MIAPLLLCAVVGTPPAAQPPVQLRPFVCPSFNESDVRHALAVELHDRLIEPTAPTPSDFLAIEIGCVGGDFIIGVERSGDTLAGYHRISRAGATGNAGARTVALAIAEVVRASDSTRSRAVEPLPSPVPHSGATKGAIFIATAGVVGGAFTSGRPLLAGGGGSFAFLWAKFGGDSDSPWTFGPRLAFDGVAASFRSGDGELVIESFGLAGLALRQFGRFRLEIAIGDRFGIAMFGNEIEPNRSARRIVGGPTAEVALGIVVGRAYVRAAFEGVIPLAAPGSFCSSRECVDFSGEWLLASVKGGALVN